MANTNIPSLPVAVFLDGTEEVWIVQGGATDKRTTTGAISQIGSVISALVQRSITSSANLPITANDQVLNVNVASPLSITVPAFSPRSGRALTFKILPGSSAVTLNATGPDTFDTVSTLTLNGGAYVTLRPYADGVNAGYAIE
jgi:hypothetical protein